MHCAITYEFSDLTKANLWCNLQLRDTSTYWHNDDADVPNRRNFKFQRNISAILEAPPTSVASKQVLYTAGLVYDGQMMFIVRRQCWKA